MTQDLLTLAIRRRSEIDREISALRLEANELDAFIEMHNKMKARLQANPPVSPQAPTIPYQISDSEGNTSATKPSPTPKSEIVKAAVGVVREHQKPVPLGDLCDALTAAGVVIGGNDPKANLSAKLGQSSELISLRKLGWWIKGEPYGDYVPGIAADETVSLDHGSDNDDEIVKDLMS